MDLLILLFWYWLTISRLNKHRMNLLCTLQLTSLFWSNAHWCKAWLGRCPPLRLGQPPVPSPWSPASDGDGDMSWELAARVEILPFSDLQPNSCNHHSKWTEDSSADVWKWLLGLPLILSVRQVKLGVSLHLPVPVAMECLRYACLSSSQCHTSLLHPGYSLSILL